jgi:hypothetical protein
VSSANDGLEISLRIGPWPAANALLLHKRHTPGAKAQLWLPLIAKAEALAYLGANTTIKQ